MMSFAGVDLGIPPNTLADWVEKTIPPAEVMEFDPFYDASAVSGLPAPPQYSPPPVRVGTLYWPTGASRWAVFHAVITSSQLTALRTSLGAGVAGYAAGTLLLEDDIQDPISTTMFMLPPRPLSGWFAEGSATPDLDDENYREPNDLYLLTLVDARYFWWFRQGTVDPDDGWQAMVDGMQEILGISDTVPVDFGSGYPTPKDRWAVTGRPIPVMLDAAAFAVGRRVVRKLDGTVHYQTWEDAKAASETYALRQYANDPDPDAAPGTKLIPFDLGKDDFRRVAGGVFDYEDIRRRVPAKVCVVYGSTAADVEDVLLSTLAMPEYLTFTGRGNEAAALRLDDLSDSEVGSVTSFALTAAEDWYGWQLCNVDVVLAGFAKWDGCGWQDVVRWSHLPTATTRVTREPWGLGAARGIAPVATATSESSFLVMPTAKCYYDGSDTRDSAGVPTGPGLNCAPNEDCLDRYITYSWTKVIESRGVSDDCPLVYTETTPPITGGPQCNPLYHEGDVDLPVFPPSSPRAANPATMDGDDSSPGDVDWVAPDGAKTSNDSYATCTITSTQTTRRLKATGFCFALAGNATITNVEVRVEGKADGEDVPDLEVALIVGGTVGGTSLHTGVDLPLVDTVRSYSATPSSWGFPSLTVLQVNSADFGVSLRYDNAAAEDRTVSIDAIEIKVSFTPSGFTAPRHCVIRIRRGDGNWYLTDQMPWVDIFRRTGLSDADGDIAYHRYYDQNTGTWKDGREVRLIAAG